MRLFTLLKNILTLGNRYYLKTGTSNLGATVTAYGLCTMYVDKPGVYLVLSGVGMRTSAPDYIMSNDISGSKGQLTSTIPTRTTANSGGGLANFALYKLDAGDYLSLSTYNYVGRAYDVRYTLLAIRLLAGGGYFIGSPVRRWAYEIVHPAKTDYQNAYRWSYAKRFPYKISERVKGLLGKGGCIEEWIGHKYSRNLYKRHCYNNAILLQRELNEMCLQWLCLWKQPHYIRFRYAYSGQLFVGARFICAVFSDRLLKSKRGCVA